MNHLRLTEPALIPRDQKKSSSSVTIKLLLSLKSLAMGVKAQDAKPFRQLPQHIVNNKTLL